MRNFLLILILTLCFQSLVKANDIRDFQIEGMSIGDSALDYFTKKEIRTERKYRIKYPNSNKFSAITFYEHPMLKVYQSVQINVKNKDKKYIIYSISGINFYNNNIDKCNKQMELISAQLIEIFPDSTITKKTKKHEYDKSGKSLIHQNIFDMDSGDEVRVECYDWSKKDEENNGWTDNLSIDIYNKEVATFIRQNS